MKINKQLFEDVLSGKLKGTFVLRNGEIYFSNDLHRNHNIFRDTHPYATSFGSYTPEGIFPQYKCRSQFDIVDFIPETNMKENELTIEIPKNHEIDWQESAKQEKIVFKKKDTKPRSWEEYLELNTGFDGAGIDWNCGGVQTIGLHHRGKAIVPTHLARPFIAMMQLMSLRQSWIGDWKPDWNNIKQIKANILCNNSEFIIAYFSDLISRPLSFPTKEMAIDFMNCFKDLLEIAKPLL